MTNDRIDQLIADFCDGTISDADLAVFSDWIRQDPANARRVAAFSTLDFGLAEYCKDTTASDLMATLEEIEASAQSPGPVDITEQLKQRKLQEKRARSGQPRRSPGHNKNASSITIPKPLFYSGLAAAILLVGWVGFALLGPDNTPTPLAQTQTPNTPTTDSPPSLRLVGRVVATDQATWTNGQAVELGQPVMNQKTQLASGIIQIELDNGVYVTLEGPCDFQPDSPGHLRLYHGKLVGRVPAKAIGFTVQTPTHQIVDLSTEFAVQVDEHQPQNTLVQVYQGKVAWQSRETNTPARVIEAGHCYSLLNKTSQPQPFHTHAFTRGVPQPRATQVAALRPTAWWAFDRLVSGRIIDRGSLGIDALVGDDATLIDARHNHAMQFEWDTAAVPLDNAPRLELGKAFTIEAWIRIDQDNPSTLRLLSNRSSQGGLGLAIGGSNYARDAFLFVDTEGKTFRGGHTNVMLTFFNELDLFTEGQVPVGEYAQIVAVVDEQGMPAIYINAVPQRIGVQEAQRNSLDPTARPRPSANPLVIGGNPDARSEQFIGLFDELAIYPRALTPEEVFDLYLAADQPATPNF